MSKEDLTQRLTYFQQRLADATARAAAKEPLPKKFAEGFTTEPIKTWPDFIKLIKERIAGIEKQLGK